MGVLGGGKRIKESIYKRLGEFFEIFEEKKQKRQGSVKIHLGRFITYI